MRLFQAQVDIEVFRDDIAVALPPAFGPGRRAGREPATVGELRARWVEATGGDAADGDDGLAAYVARRATLALDRAEYRLLGPRYKTPSLVKEEILASRRFRAGLAELRQGEGAAAALGADRGGGGQDPG